MSQFEKLFFKITLSGLIVSDIWISRSYFWWLIDIVKTLWRDDILIIYFHRLLMLRNISIRSLTIFTVLIGVKLRILLLLMLVLTIRGGKLIWILLLYWNRHFLPNLCLWWDLILHKLSTVPLFIIALFLLLIMIFHLSIQSFHQRDLISPQALNLVQSFPFNLLYHFHNIITYRFTFLIYLFSHWSLLSFYLFILFSKLIWFFKMRNLYIILFIFFSNWHLIFLNYCVLRWNPLVGIVLLLDPWSLSK